MAYEDAVQLPNGAWFDITAFRLRVLQLNATTPAVPEGGRIRLASGYTHDVELMVARLALADGGVAVSTPDSLHGIRLPNGNVYDAFDLNRRLVARDGGVTCFLPRIGATLTNRADDVRLKVTPGGFVGGGDGSPAVPMAFKAHGHRFRIPDTFGGGSAWANGTRARVAVPPGATGRVRYFWPTFTRGGTNFADQDLLYDVNFQAAISKTWNNAYTGLAPRSSFLVNGGKTASYLAASPQGPGIMSDILDLGSVTPGSFVDVFCSFEAAAKTSQGSSKIPTGLFFGTTKFNVCEVSKNTSSSLVDVDWCASVSDVNSDGKNTVGGFAGLLFWEVPQSNRLVYAIGHSITWGTGEGDLTATNDGDLRGDPDGYLGYFDNWMRREGLMYLNAGKPTDQIQYRADPTKTVRSRALAALSGATDIYLADLTNDVFGRTTAQMTTDTQTVFTAFGGDIAAALGKQPLKTMAVMYPKATGKTPTALTSSGTTCTAATDMSFNVGETVIVSGASPAAYNGTFTVTSVNPGVSFTYEALSAPGTAATGTITLDDRLIKANGLNQVPFSSFGPGSKADTMDAATRALQLGNDRAVDLAAAVRYGATNSYLWLTDPANPYPYVKDRIHMNSRGRAKVVTAAPGYPS